MRHPIEHQPTRGGHHVLLGLIVHSWTDARATSSRPKPKPFMILVLRILPSHRVGLQLLLYLRYRECEHLRYTAQWPTLELLAQSFRRAESLQGYQCGRIVHEAMTATPSIARSPRIMCRVDMCIKEYHQKWAESASFSASFTNPFSPSVLPANSGRRPCRWSK